MNTRKQMLIAKGEIITPKVKFCNYNKSTGKWDIVFNNGKKFSYNYNNVSFLTEPEVLNPALHKIESRSDGPFHSLYKNTGDLLQVFRQDFRNMA